MQALRKARPDVLTLLVFNDLVLLAAPVDRGSLFKSRKAEPVRLRVLSPQEGGIGSVDDLKEIKGWGGEWPSVFSRDTPRLLTTIATQATAVRLPSACSRRLAARRPSSRRTRLPPPARARPRDVSYTVPLARRCLAPASKR